MRDDSQRWDVPFAPNHGITMPDVTVQSVALERQILLSGPNVLARCNLPLIEWPLVGDQDSYALSIRRDRLLLVNGPDMTDGWDADQGQAVSDVSDGYAVFEISGDGAFDMLRRGTEISLEVPSRSVSRLLFGLGAFVYRFNEEKRFRVHAASAQRQALWENLRRAAEH